MLQKYCIFLIFVFIFVFYIHAFELAPNSDSIFPKPIFASDGIKFPDGTRLSGLGMPGSRYFPGLDCLSILQAYPPAWQNTLPNGLYYIITAGDETPQPVYCDMTTDGGGWTLLTKFSQHQACTADLDFEDYFAAFGRAGWIQGINVSRPLSPEPTDDPVGITVESLNWRPLLTANPDFQLRQRMVNYDRSIVRDVAGTTHFEGYLLQDEAPTADKRWWPFSSRTVFENSGIYPPGTDQPADVLTGFYPPYTAELAGTYYLGCYSGRILTVSSDCGFCSCAESVSVWRRYGAAGIISFTTDGSLLDHDFGSAWIPFTDIDTNGNGGDIVYVHAATNLFGRTNNLSGTIVGSYWFRPLRP
eukprot:GCRY01001952.1.p1 GENE.GCRY01001952.1~~GCRY01001952.1.p1  ORF type:complete len:359 (+),score=55.84 GCRY01001952.1:143-1219(+)